MNDPSGDNPYQSPIPTSEHESQLGLDMLERLARKRRERRRYQIVCYLIAAGLVVIGFGLKRFWSVGPQANGLIAASGTALIFLGLIVFLLGPISWFWFQNQR